MVTIARPRSLLTDRTSSHSVPHVPGLACALVRCGTSRAVIVRGEDLPADESREYVLHTVMNGENVADTLGGEHYQLNKLAVISRLPERSWFSFRFYQFDRGERRLLPDMECANVAAGAALAALIDGMVMLDVDGVLHAINEGTGQQVDLQPQDASHPWASPWEIRFVHDGGLRVEAFGREEPLVAVHPSGRQVNYWVAKLGNLFVLANTSPEDPDGDLLEHLATAGRHPELSPGGEPGDGPAPKLLLYRTDFREATEAWVSAACFYGGERHQSLPGSGAMCLASFLTLCHLSDLQPTGYAGAFICNLRHPSGQLAVTIEWRRNQRDYQVVSAAFTTPVRLLMSGTAPLPMFSGGQQ